MHDTSLTMVNDTLGEAPQIELSPAYRLRWYHPGDEAEWIAIHKVADLHYAFSPELFQQQFSGERLDLADRQCYLLDQQDRFVATGTAWAATGGEFAGYGRVHWVAVLPEYQRRGIGTILMAVLCRRLLALGHARAYLTTATFRRPAIRLYRKFGFGPVGHIENREE